MTNKKSYHTFHVGSTESWTFETGGHPPNPNFAVMDLDVKMAQVGAKKTLKLVPHWTKMSRT